VQSIACEGVAEAVWDAPDGARAAPISTETLSLTVLSRTAVLMNP
jgi:hypothetical protein